MDEIKSETGLDVYKYDADEDENVLAAWDVISVPTVVHMDIHGNEVARIMGAMPKAVAMRELKI